MKTSKLACRMGRVLVPAVILLMLLFAAPASAGRPVGCGKVGGWEVFARNTSCYEARAVVASWQDQDLSVCTQFGCLVRGYDCRYKRSRLRCHRGHRAAFAHG